MTNWAKLAGKLVDDQPKLSDIWAVKLKIPLMNRKYLLFDAMGPNIYFRRYGYEPFWPFSQHFLIVESVWVAINLLCNISIVMCGKTIRFSVK